MPERLRRLARSIGHACDAQVAVRAAKNLRNALVDHAFRRRDHASGPRFAAELAARGGGRAAFAVAFNSPWVVDLLTRAWSRHQPGLPLAIIDNSSSREARAAHVDLCRSRGVPYLPLPPNPEWSPNRSHGIALNWIWFNVVRHLDLEFVGFVDHDCIPVAGCDLPRRMEARDAYGLWGASKTHPEAWNLWAGYCFLRPAAAAGRTVDFKHRIEQGLDTGGGNWRGFYRDLDRDRVGEAVHRWVKPDLGPGAEAAACLLLDEAFLHLEGASYMPWFRDETLRARLAAVIESGALGFLPAAPRGAAEPAAR